MDYLLRCRRCGHGAALHDGSGCASCRCPENKDDIVEDGLKIERDEYRNAWQRPALPLPARPEPS